MTSLISFAELSELLKTDSLILLDCQTDLSNRELSYGLFAKEHIPTAQFVSLEDDLSSEAIPGKTGRHPLPTEDKLEKLIQKLGIHEHSDIVVYDQANAMFAVRAWWLLKWAGLKNVRVLNGGLANWKKQGGEVTTEPHQATHSDYKIQVKQEWIADINDVLSDNGQSLLLDARAKPRYLGEEEPLDKKAGHIPGAWNADFSINLNSDGLFLSREELAKRFAPVTEQPKPVICYCGSGVTACHNILSMIEAGLPMPKLYPGSWSEWSADDQHPIETKEEGSTL